MKILQTEITPRQNSYISVSDRNEAYFESPFHFHPEIELVYIKESFGKRIIGDKIESFEAGDLVLIGPNLPHVWLNDECFYKGETDNRAQSIVIYFNKDIFGKGFYDLREAEKINSLFDRARRGIKINGTTFTEVTTRMEKLLTITGFERIIILLEIMHLISTSQETEYINKEEYSGVMYKADGDRLSEVFKYITTNYKNDISLKDVATMANLTPQSFCRLFKKRMNKNFVDYLHEVRISHACRYLMDTDWTISEIAYSTGFKTVSNFNKLFKESTGLCPTDYRMKIA